MPLSKIGTGLIGLVIDPIMYRSKIGCGGNAEILAFFVQASITVNPVRFAFAYRRRRQRTSVFHGMSDSMELTKEVYGFENLNYRFHVRLHR